MLCTLCDSVFDRISAIPCDNKYDLIIISHVLEHVPNPRSFIDSIIPFLANNSIIFIEVPCLDFLYSLHMIPTFSSLTSRLSLTC